MDTEPALTPIRADLGAVRRRAVRHELLELLVLRHRAVAAGVAGTVVVGLVVTLVAPGVLPATAVTGAVVGLVALLVGIGVGLAVHRRDPMLRAPGQARWDGSSVLAWVPSLADERELAPAVDVLRARLATGGTQRLLVVEGGGDARGAASMLGEAAAAGGIRSLVVDLTDTRPQAGMAAVGDGTVRLADAVEMAESRKLARIGAGRRVADSVAATVEMLARPSRDLELAIVVAPDDAASRSPLAPAVDRVVLVVQSGARERTAVRDRLAQFDDGVPAELLLVGGHLTDGAMARVTAPDGPDDVAAADATPNAPVAPPPVEVELGSRQRVVVPPPTPPAAPPTDEVPAVDGLEAPSTEGSFHDAAVPEADDTDTGTSDTAVADTAVADVPAVRVLSPHEVAGHDGGGSDRQRGADDQAQATPDADEHAVDAGAAERTTGRSRDGAMDDDVRRAAAAVAEPLSSDDDPVGPSADADAGPRAVATLDPAWQFRAYRAEPPAGESAPVEDPVASQDQSWHWGADASAEHGPAAATVTIDVDPDATADISDDGDDDVHDARPDAALELAAGDGPARTAVDGPDERGTGGDPGQPPDPVPPAGDVDAGRDADDGGAGTIDLAEPRDLVTSATLELLASGDGDERR